MENFDGKCECKMTNNPSKWRERWIAGMISFSSLEKALIGNKNIEMSTKNKEPAPIHMIEIDALREAEAEIERNETLIKDLLGVIESLEKKQKSVGKTVAAHLDAEKARAAKRESELKELRTGIVELLEGFNEDATFQTHMPILIRDLVREAIAQYKGDDSK